MGTAGSVEQRNAIKNVVMISDSTKKRDKAEIMQILSTFCNVFPLETTERKSNETEDTFDVKEKRLYDAVHRLLKTAVDTNATGNSNESDIVLMILEAFKRILQWRELHKLVPKYSIKPFLTCMMWSPEIALSVLGVLLSMKTRPAGLKTTEIGDKIEMVNKRTFADDQGYQVLGSLLTQQSNSENNSLSVRILEDSLRMFHWTYVANKQTSDSVTLDRVTDALLNARLTLLCLSHHSQESLRHLAIDILLELFFVADLTQVTILQDAARDSGALLYMVAYALEDDDSEEEVRSRRDSDNSVYVDPSYFTLRTKAIQLVEMFCAGNSRSKSAMYRMLPVDLFVPIEDRPDLISKYTMASIKKSTMSKTRSMDIMSFREARFSASGSFTGSNKPVEFQRWLQDARAQGETWKEVMAAARHVHERPNLVWRKPMLQELQLALQVEIDVLEAQTNRLHWDFELFQVNYDSFSSELVVHGYFIEQLLPKLADLNDPYEVSDLIVLAWHLSDRLGVETDPSWRRSCVRCLRLMLRRYAMTFNGQLPVVGLLRHLEDAQHDPTFASECFQLFHVAISTARTRATDSLTSYFSPILVVVVAALKNVMETQAANTRQSASWSRASSTLSEGDHDVNRLTFETLDDQSDDEESVESSSIAPSLQIDAMIRAGVNVLAVIIQRAKYIVPQVVAAHQCLLRLFAASTLRPKTISTLLLVFTQILTHSYDAEALKRKLLPYILLACSNPLNRGMCHASASFLSSNYKPSDFQAILQESVGHYGCGLHLVLEEPLVLSAIFNSDTVRAADIFWGATLRTRLFQALSAQCDVDLSENFHDAVDLEAEMDICVGHLYLRSFVDYEGTFRTKWTQEMYNTTIQALVQKIALAKSRSSFNTLTSEADPMELQVLLLKALLVLIPRAGHHIPIDASVFDILLSPLKRSLLSEVDQSRASVGLKLMEHIISPTSENVNASACLDALVTNGLSVLHEGLEKITNTRYLQFVREQPPSGPALSLVSAICDILVTLVQLPRGLEALLEHSRLLIRLFTLTTPTVAQSATQVTQELLVCLSKLCRSESLSQALLVHAGGVIYLSQLCAALDYNDTSAYNAAIELAAGILQTNASTHHEVLSQLFTPGLVKILTKDPVAFLRTIHVADDIYQPTVIWTSNMKNILRETIRVEVAKIEVSKKATTIVWPVWDPEHFIAADSFRYLYPEVADEILVAGIYIRLFVQNDIRTIDDIKVFSQELLNAHASTTQQVEAMQARGAFPQKLQNKLEHIRQALRKVVVAYPELELPFDEDFSDTESIGDDISNLIETSPTNSDAGGNTREPSSAPFELSKQESIQLDEIVV